MFSPFELQNMFTSKYRYSREVKEKLWWNALFRKLSLLKIVNSCYDKSTASLKHFSFCILFSFTVALIRLRVVLFCCHFTLLFACLYCPRWAEQDEQAAKGEFHPCLFMGSFWLSCLLPIIFCSSTTSHFSCSYRIPSSELHVRFSTYFASAHHFSYLLPCSVSRLLPPLLLLFHSRHFHWKY